MYMYMYVSVYRETLQLGTFHYIIQLTAIYYGSMVLEKRDLPCGQAVDTCRGVVNTFLYSGNFWLAWIVDENGTDCELRKIPSPTK